ncbi:MAG: lipase family protein [Candidatus Saccharimonadales bacterium]
MMGSATVAADPLPQVPQMIDSVIPSPQGDLAHMMMPSPSGDPFFDVTPRHLGSLERGQLVSVRRVNAHTNVQFGPNVREVRQLKFRTTDSHGRPTFGTATAIIPTGNLATSGILVNNVPINSLGRKCTPGYKIAQGEVEDNLLSPPIAVIGNAVRNVVLIPDHEGPTMAYAEPIAGGQLVLDAVLALRNAYPVLQKSRFVMRGYSGGSIVTYGATTLMRQYAPSLVPQYAGASLGGTPINQYMLTQSMAGMMNWAKGLFWAGTAGIVRQNPSLIRYANKRYALADDQSSQGYVFGSTNGIRGVTYST